jgi:pyruvate carboxylase
VAKAYHAANLMFGDIVKVTPSSKVVGDMALMMVGNDLTAEQVLDPAVSVTFPASVIDMLRGDLGQPPGGWPPALQRKALGDEAPITERPGALLPPADLAAARTEAEKRCGRALNDAEFAAFLMYPKVTADFLGAARKYGPVSTLPTPVYFYGMAPGDEISVEIEKGKALVIRLLTVTDTDEEGQVRVFFELNGQPRVVRVPNRSAAATLPSRRKAEEGNDAHVAARMPGAVATIAVRPGQSVNAGDVLLTLEAMKMEMALPSTRAGVVEDVLVRPGASVEAKDLLVILKAA